MNNQSHIETNAGSGNMINRPVFFISAGLIILFCIYGGVFSNQAATTFTAVQSWLVTNFGWFYMGVVALFFGFVVYLGFSRFARSGSDQMTPRLTTAT